MSRALQVMMDARARTHATYPACMTLRAALMMHLACAARRPKVARKLSVGLSVCVSVCVCWVDGWVDGWMGGWVGGWVDGWVGGWMGGRAGVGLWVCVLGCVLVGKTVQRGAAGAALRTGGGGATHTRPEVRERHVWNEGS